MLQTDKEFTGSIPEFYDTYLVPLIFTDCAEDLAKRVASQKPSSVLEIAAGSGVVPRILAPLLSPTSRYVVTDLNPAMLDHAEQRQGEPNNIEWLPADALDLPFAADTFDVAHCQHGVMFFPDRIAGYQQAHRVLKPGGTFVFNVWDQISENEFANTVTEVASQFFPKDPPRFLARTPHGYSDPEQIKSDLHAAGFAKVEIETRAGVSAAPSARHPAIAYCQGTPLRAEIEARDAGLLSEITEQAAKVIADRFGDGPVKGKIQSHVITATTAA
ncbi:SAM-dependent methyltransferase [Sedimentitalea sp. CY04]|uniref:SAM-dependent methyltransferase n=1 Tax=Parasedimentitalea denitrificans TaxID=2211118 RepID=A0ABX0WBV8_9RHOB|nr:class I SAM-dependent methyltransferase [Sedimentitalea sp. CY04]NIZ62142.1 SAM-dependent methyltransferase [Sedimentitalea sp. CY04]